MAQPRLPVREEALRERQHAEAPKELTGKGAVWLSIISSAPGAQGFVTPEQEKAYLAEKQAAPTDVLFDSDGTVGHLYGAKTTPHMFVINDKGVLVYAGAIDDNLSSDAADAATAKNFVRAAYDEASAGKPVSTASTAAVRLRREVQELAHEAAAGRRSTGSGSPHRAAGSSIDRSKRRRATTAIALLPAFKSNW